MFRCSSYDLFCSYTLQFFFWSHELQIIQSHSFGAQDGKLNHHDEELGDDDDDDLGDGKDGEDHHEDDGDGIRWQGEQEELQNELDCTTHS